MITNEMTNWLDSNNTEDYKKVFVTPIDSTEGTERQRLGLPVIPEAVQGIGEWQKNEK